MGNLYDGQSLGQTLSFKGRFLQKAVSGMEIKNKNTRKS